MKIISLGNTWYNTNELFLSYSCESFAKSKTSDVFCEAKKLEVDQGKLLVVYAPFVWR
jgi:hypothetical protein